MVLGKKRVGGIRRGKGGILSYLPEALSTVHSGAVDKKGMEEDRVSLFHLQVDPWVIGAVVKDAMVHLVHATLE